MIRLENVTKTYQSGKKNTLTAVDGVSLYIATGEIFGIIGYSGAGKSSLLRCINLLERPTSGSIYVGEKSMTTLGTRALQKERTKIGMIFQHFHLLHSATVAENIAFPLKLQRAPRAVVTEKVRSLLELVGLSGYERHYPSQLSGGQKQRVAIARALANDPDVLLCDEATSALDPQTTRSILDLLLDLHRRLKLTVVLVTHEMAVIQRVCDRVAVMDKGKVVEAGTVADVFLNPQNAVTKRILNTEDAIERPAVQEHVSSDATVFEVTFVGELTYQPVLAEVGAKTGASFSILKGTIGTLKDVPYGRLTVAWYEGADAARAAVDELRARGCTVTDISHVDSKGFLAQRTVK